MGASRPSLAVAPSLAAPAPGSIRDCSALAPPHPELPLLSPLLCHSRFWDHLPISVACSLKLIICQCELGWDCEAWRGIRILLFSNRIPLGPHAPGAAPRLHQKVGGYGAAF